MARTAADPTQNYLRQLKHELRGIPRRRKRELLDEIRNHLETSLAERPAADDAEIRQLIERVGDPREIAAEERAALGEPHIRVGWKEISALILLPIGGVIVPLVGWIVGAVLLWSSTIWTLRDKLIGTLVLPGGLASAFSFGFYLSGENGTTCTTRLETLNGAEVVREQCSSGVSGAKAILLWTIWVVLILVPIASTLYLVVRMRRREAPA